MGAAVDALQAAESSHQWLNQHLPELREEYPNEYVAVKEDEVVAHAADADELHASLEEQGYDMMHVVVKYIREKGSVVIR